MVLSRCCKLLVPRMLELSRSMKSAASIGPPYGLLHERCCAIEGMQSSDYAERVQLILRVARILLVVTRMVGRCEIYRL
jgi:hypothetical protein